MLRGQSLWEGFMRSGKIEDYLLYCKENAVNAVSEGEGTTGTDHDQRRSPASAQAVGGGYAAHTPHP